MILCFFVVFVVSAVSAVFYKNKIDDRLVVYSAKRFIAEGTGFEPADTLRYRQFSKLLV